MFSKLCVVALLAATCYAEVAQVAAPTRNGQCPRSHGYYKDDASCDIYIVCDNYVPTQMLCPDGLHFNPEIKWPEYPCGYPIDVPCTGRGAIQPAIPTAECPHQYGYYRSTLTSEVECDKYKVCIAGKAIERHCAPGLAYDDEYKQCDFPEKVRGCDVEKFLGFTCPAGPTDALGRPIPDLVLNYGFPDRAFDPECRYFFSCDSQGRARLLSCDHGLAYDPQERRCIDDELVDCRSQQYDYQAGK